MSAPFSETAASGPVEDLRAAFAAAAASLRDDGSETLDLTIERPPREQFGDYSSNAAMLLAPLLGQAPREIADRVGEILAGRLGEQLDRVEVAGPGFVNVFLADAWYLRALTLVRGLGADFGRSTLAAGERQRVLVEFVSANPTGPLTAAGGRHAAFGDALCRVLEFVGHKVEREFYVNDYGTQIELFGKSIAARMNREQPPDGGYGGEYVSELASQLAAAGASPDDVEALARMGVEAMLEKVRATLERYRVTMDRYFLESSLHEDDAVSRVLGELEQGESIYESEGASWLRTTAHGDDKDRVLRRSSGELTYFATDIAYHEHKLSRGFDHLVNVLGADHHGYVGRMKAAFAILDSPEKIELIIMQLVHVIERGERARMSKRKGDFVTLDELVDDIGVDAARFFMLQRSHDTTIDLDLDLARDQSDKNPVYYVQYAHARICSILRNAGEERLARALSADLTGIDGLEPAEKRLIKRLLELPEVTQEAAAKRAPHKLTTFAHELSADFSAFYRDCHVIGAEPQALEDLRLCLCHATRQSIATMLDLLGVSAPEQM